MGQPGIQPFQLRVPDEDLDDLRDRLRRTRLPAEVAGSGWTYGTSPDYMRELLAYWLHDYDWRTAEAQLNRLPQFQTTVQGLHLHFVHAQGRGPAPFPLLFSHGWPGSFWEVHKIIGPLTDPAAHGGDPGDAFDVVAPSLPGYGFSADPGRPGVTPAVIAAAFRTLMTEVLGYPRFGAQGGDWGALVTTVLGRDHPDVVAGIHLNMMGAVPQLGPDAVPLTQAEQDFLAASQKWRQAEGGYQRIQGTKPQTLAYGLPDSPVGLAAWIVEKFRPWSDCDGEVESVFTKDELLTNIMIYWVSGCIGSSVRLYYEAGRHGWRQLAGGYVEAPTGFARFAGEITVPPREWVERAYNVQRWAEFAHGGHFAALEQPEILVEEIRAFFRPLRG